MLKQRRWFWVVVMFGVSVGWIAVPQPWVFVYLSVLVAYLAYGYWSCFPGRCAFCKSREASPVPRATYVPPAWWDFRFPRRRDVIWMCEFHYMTVVRAEEWLAARKRRQP
jgi:hypothetical protein